MPLCSQVTFVPIRSQTQGQEPDLNQVVQKPSQDLFSNWNQERVVLCVEVWVLHTELRCWKMSLTTCCHERLTAEMQRKHRLEVGSSGEDFGVWLQLLQRPRGIGIFSVVGSCKPVMLTGEICLHRAFARVQDCLCLLQVLILDLVGSSQGCC